MGLFDRLLKRYWERREVAEKAEMLEKFKEVLAKHDREADEERANKHVGSSAAELFDMPDSNEEVYPENNEYHSEDGTELQFTIHHGRFIEVTGMTIDLSIIPLIGYQDGLLTLVLVIGEKFEHYPCSEGNYEALQAIWMKVRLTGL